MLNDDDILADDEHSEDTEKNNAKCDPDQCNESDFDFEKMTLIVITARFE